MSLRVTSEQLPLVIAVAVPFGLSYLQTKLLLGRGTDHFAHLFLVRRIRENHHRLFVRIPRLLNPAYCGSYPLFLHWVLSFLSDKGVDRASRWLNPTLNVVQTLVCFLGLRSLGVDDREAAWSTLVFSLTPQFYHAYSPRNYGLSSRSLGLLLFMTLGFTCLGLQGADVPWGRWALASMTAYLIWGFNLFGVQMMLLIGTVLALFGLWQLIVAAFLGLGVFLLLHPKYAAGYLRHTARFTGSYATEMAEPALLRSRPSLWRDLVWDIWRQLAQDFPRGVSYAYANSLLILVFLNPLVIGSTIHLLYSNSSPIVSRLEWFAAAGLIVSLATSLRFTRFLGEPERYAEAVAPFAAPALTLTLLRSGIPSGIHGVLAYSILAILANFIVIRAQLKRSSNLNLEVRAIESAIATSLAGSQIRLCSNNEEVTKLLMLNEWEFFRMWAEWDKPGGFEFRDAYSSFPLLRPPFLKHIVSDYRINVCVLDRENFWDMPELPGARVSELKRTDRLKAIRIEWDGEGRQSG